ncbi:MAG TPA: histidine kinase [Anaerolineae bacterium]|nr:GAF domain-containing protein [Anaerolineae bacterium]MCB0177474.1 GAF domain-containing protein [Anaerolineae bacterium]MCB9103060.1 GAF domain-containing protein [Anaerolineales bacterium]HRV96059.1 histidine kinase [Anaerolineae bacterium]
MIRVLNDIIPKSANPQVRIALFLLAYRWISLFIVIWLFQITPATYAAPVISVAVLVTAIIITSLITLFHQPLKRIILEDPFFLGVDIFSVAVILTLSGVTESPYTLYALSPLLAAAFFFHMKGALWAAGGFTFLYLATLFLGNQTYPITVEPHLLINQLAGLWLVTILFGSLSELLKQLQNTHNQLAEARDDLTRQNGELASARDHLSQQNAELAVAHHQLEIIHDLTLMLQGASDIKSAQQRVLRAVTEELGFSQAIVGLVNPATSRLEHWQMRPANDELLAALNPIALTSASGPVVKELLAHRGGWWFNERPAVADEVLNEWLSRSPWLSLPMVLQEQIVGVLLVTAEGGRENLSDDQIVGLTAVASQAAVALGTVDRVKQLAVEQERNRIARDIHDSVAQSLFGTVFTLDACIKMLPEHVDVVQNELVDLRNLAEQVRQEVRHSIFDIWPSELTLEQFKLDLYKYVAHCSGSNDFHVDFTIGGGFDNLSPSIRRSLYRITQEALANVAHHAQVKVARVSLFVEPDEVQLSIRDQGRGFDPKIALTRLHNRDKFGLRGIRERVERLDGEVEILSQFGRGTQILVRIPIDRRNGYG